MLGSRTRFELVALPVFFFIKLGGGLILLKFSSVFLSIDDFSIFAQFLLLGAILNMVSVGGVQNGLVGQMAANSEPEFVASLRGGAFLIWLTAIIIFALPIVVFQRSVSNFLIGDISGQYAVCSITLAVFIAGPAQIFCAELTGERRSHLSLLAQGIAILFATAACIMFLNFGQPLAAACAFYWGSVVSVPISWVFVRTDLTRNHYRIIPQIAQAVQLLRYSVAFIALVAITSISLFVLRYVYHDAFGLEKLGFWLVAQRVSDTSTQLLGLYMAQYFLPQLAGAVDGSGDRTIIIRGWIVATGAMAGILACFVIAPGFAVTVFLSERYLPAVGLITLYMGGDVMRATVSLAMHVAFAKNQLVQYVAIEATAMGLFSAITLILIAYNNTIAPFIAYISAFGTVAVLLVVFYMWRHSIKRMLPSHSK